MRSISNFNQEPDAPSIPHHWKIDDRRHLSSIVSGHILPISDLVKDKTLKWNMQLEAHPNRLRFHLLSQYLIRSNSPWNITKKRIII